MNKISLKKAFHAAYKAGEAKGAIVSRLKDGENDRMLKSIVNNYPSHVDSKKYHGRHILANIGVHLLNFGSAFLGYFFLKEKVSPIFTSPEAFQEIIARQNPRQAEELQEMMTEADFSEYSTILESVFFTTWIPAIMLTFAIIISLIILIFAHKKKATHYTGLLVAVILFGLNIIPLVIGNVFGTPMIVSHPVISILGIAVTIGVGYLVFDTKRKLFPKS